jgi:hypothetical protein
MSFREEKRRRDLQRLHDAGCAVEQRSLQFGLAVDWLASPTPGLTPGTVMPNDGGTVLLLQVRLSACVRPMRLIGFRVVSADAREFTMSRPCAAHAGRYCVHGSPSLSVKADCMLAATRSTPLFLMPKYPRYGLILAFAPMEFAPGSGLTLHIDDAEGESRPYSFVAQLRQMTLKREEGETPAVP